MTTNDSNLGARTSEILIQVQSLVKTQEKIASLTGERFNIFKIIGLQNREVTTHSAFIGNLLDPKGTHGKGSLFLRLFLEQIKPHALQTSTKDFEPETARVHLEYWLGPKSETTGGRVDLFLLDGKSRKILIENKIFAGDQENQMLRYREHDKKAELLYLTLHGSECESEELKAGEDYSSISYADEILKWITACRKEVCDIPIIRESMTHYSILIKELTKQNLDTTMSKEIKSIILRDIESYKSFCLLTSY